MGNVGVTSTKSGDYHFFYLVHNQLAIHLWYLEYGGACSVFDHPKTCHFLEYKFVKWF